MQVDEPPRREVATQNLTALLARVRWTKHTPEDDQRNDRFWRI
jgi:hypothetical protein